MKRNILVFPCGSEIALDIFSSLKYSTYFHLIGASSVEDHGGFVYEDYIPGLPYVTHDSFIKAIKDIVSYRHIDAIYPAMDIAISVLKEHEEELGCLVVAPSNKLSDICLSKRKTYKELLGVINIPEQYNPKAVSEFPCFAKPNIGYGARGTSILYSQEEVDRFVNEGDDILVMEYLPGEEFTVDCFSDRNHKLLYASARQRNRIKSGISVNTSFVDDQTEFRLLAEKINSKMEFRGAWFFQVKRDAHGELALLEIAARLGGSSLLANATGVNLAALTLFDLFGYDVSVAPNQYYVELDRALNEVYKVDISYSCVYVDYDDCLVLEENHVNQEMVQFIFQCINNGKKVFLLSKHNGDLYADLQHNRLAGLFDGVYHLKKNEDKYSYIHESDAVFIDDSYAERLRVQKELGIPVFSPEMIRILM